MKDNEDITKIDFDKFENNVVDQINKDIDGLIQMSYIQRAFLNGLIRYYKPKKIVEVGIAAGGSSAVILNAIKDIDGAKLHSIEYNKQFYGGASKLSGFLVTEKFKDISGDDKWELHAGGCSSKFIDNIGGDIDLCLLDSTHCNPGEFLDYLAILPYLKKNAIVIMHDIMLHCYPRWRTTRTTNGTLFSSLNGKKLYPRGEDSEGFGLPNIGAVVLDDNAKENALDTFLLLTLPWLDKGYSPSLEDNSYIQSLFSKHYPKELIDIYTRCYIKNREEIVKFTVENSLSTVENSLSTVENSLSTVENSLSTVENSLLKLINTIAWWIPIKKLRDKFRAKFF